MRLKAGLIFSAPLVALTPACGGAGTATGGWTTLDGSPSVGVSSSGSSGSAGSPAPVSGAGSSSSSGGAAASSGSSGTDASAAGLDSSAAGTPGADGGSRADGASSGGLVGAGGDGGLLPYKGVANSACADLPKLAVSWWYNWTQSGSCSPYPFVPMVWGHPANEQTPAAIASAISNMVKAGNKTVLGFNEPDNTTQSNMSVATAISLWPSFNSPSIRIGSPATQGNSGGLTWIKSFMSQVDADTTGSLRVDFIATHWYGWNAGSCDAAATNLEGWIKGIEAIPGNRPIWITEWGCLNQSNPSAAVVQAFFSGAVTMLAKHPRVERHAWYPWTTNNELVTSGALTSLGTVFSAAPASK
jgi:putative glycosyl hydrolase